MEIVTGAVILRYKFIITRNFDKEKKAPCVSVDRDLIGFNVNVG